MTDLHDNRRSRIERLRKKIADDIYEERRASNFDVLASTGPYAGLRILSRTATHGNNGDEENTKFNKYAGNFSKGLKHKSDTGFVEEGSYRQFKAALDGLIDGDLIDRGAIAAIDAVPRGDSNGRTFVNPLAGLGSDVQGLDPLDIAIPPAPKLGSLQAATELVELYWMALLRDVPFHEWDANADAGDAAVELNKLNSLPTPAGEERFAQHYEGGALTDAVNVARLFRGSAEGNTVGPYISQFLLQDVSFGTLDFEQRQHLIDEGKDYLTEKNQWLAAQNGSGKEPGRLELEKSGRSRHIITLRDLAHYVHFDALHEAYFNAALILDRLGFPLAAGNPYRTSMKQRGFGTFGGPYVLTLLTEVATRALKAVWHQKWYVHRRLRPEAMGGRAALASWFPGKGYETLVHPELLGSEALKRTMGKNSGSPLLPMAFPEGSPMHPAYGAGHATVAGACVTILKALFDTTATFQDKAMVAVVKNGETDLEEYKDGGKLTVGGELNKLAANVAIGRNAGGVHYRTDYTKSLALGEAVAIAILQEQAMTYKEGGATWAIETFAGNSIVVADDGRVSRAGPEPAAAPQAEERPERAKSLFAS